jgi:transcriptional regulator with XRE-family HTH domain
MAANVESEVSIGAWMRALRLRGGLKQEELARLASSSRSVISRLERGQRLPDRSTIKRLDDALQAGGELEARWLHTRGLDKEPLERWVHNYPAAYHGLIWMSFTSSPQDDTDEIAFEVRWGPWVLRKRLRWPATRTVALWHTKGDDGLSIPVIVRSNRPLIVEFHVGPPPEKALDINPGWINDGT